MLAVTMAAPVAAQLPEMAMASESLLADAIHEEVVIDDPSGDAATDFGGVPGAGTAVDGMADILSLSMGESESHFMLAWQHREYDETFWAVTATAAGQYYCGASFIVDGHDSLLYRAFWGSQINIPAEGGLYGYVYRTDMSGERRDYEYDFDAVVGFANERVEFTFSKDFVVAKGKQPLAVGDRIAVQEAYCYYAPAALFAGGHYDRAGPEYGSTLGGKYTVRAASGSESLALAFASEAYNADPDLPISLAAGKTSRLVVDVTNKQDHKALVSIAAGLVGPSGETLPDWSVAVANHIEVPAETTVPLSVIVTAPNGTDVGPAGALWLEAKPLSDETAATLRRSIAVAPELGPELRTLHAYNGYREDCLFCLGIDMPAVVDASMDWLVLSARDDDPRYDRSDVEDAPLNVFRFTDIGMAMLDPTATVTALDPDGTIDVDVVLSTDVERELYFEVEVVADWYDVYLGGTSGTVAIGTERSAIRFEVPVSDDEKIVLPEGTTFQVYVYIYDVLGNIAEPAPQLYADGSSVTFPFVKPSTGSYALTDGRAIPTVTLRDGSDAEDYVNPGKKHVFEMALVNEGIEADVLEVELVADDADWRTRVEPGFRFKLEPGQRAPFSIVATAPTDAEEGDNVTIRVIARSANDEAATTEIVLALLVTTGIELDDQDYAAAGEDEHVAPYLDDAEESPGLPIVAILASLALLGAAVRRRRD